MNVTHDCAQAHELIHQDLQTMALLFQLRVLRDAVQVVAQARLGRSHLLVVRRLYRVG